MKVLKVNVAAGTSEVIDDGLPEPTPDPNYEKQMKDGRLDFAKLKAKLSALGISPAEVE